MFKSSNFLTFFLNFLSIFESKMDPKSIKNRIQEGMPQHMRQVFKMCTPLKRSTSFCRRRTSKIEQKLTNNRQTNRLKNQWKFNRFLKIFYTFLVTKRGKNRIKIDKKINKKSMIFCIDFLMNFCRFWLQLGGSRESSSWRSLGS